MDEKPAVQIDQQRHEGKKAQSAKNAKLFTLQKEAFYSVMQCFQSLKPEQWESLYSDGSFTVDDAVVMNKYITSGYEMLVAKDASKYN